MEASSTTTASAASGRCAIVPEAGGAGDGLQQAVDRGDLRRRVAPPGQTDPAQRFLQPRGGLPRRSGQQGAQGPPLLQPPQQIQNGGDRVGLPAAGPARDHRDSPPAGGRGGRALVRVGPPRQAVEHRLHEGVESQRVEPPPLARRARRDRAPAGPRTPSTDTGTVDRVRPGSAGVSARAGRSRGNVSGPRSRTPRPDAIPGSRSSAVASSRQTSPRPAARLTRAAARTTSGSGGIENPAMNSPKRRSRADRPDRCRSTSFIVGNQGPAERVHQVGFRPVAENAGFPARLSRSRPRRKT